jgi:UDPglucose--hexose-1-phosphate uridylyltransferase
MSAGLLGDVVGAYHTRYCAHQRAAPGAHTILFRNRGAEAGTSLAHAHAQLYTVREPVPEIELRHRLATAFWQERGECLLCSLGSLEPDAGGRTVAENTSFVARVPWAPATSLEVWIIPKIHQASFGEMEGGQPGDLAEVLGTVLRRYRDRCGNPPYNAVWHGHPLDVAGAPGLHWYVQLRPRISRQAGFELASGVDVCPTDPVEDARRLR